jgi:hypothetical protein
MRGRMVNVGVDGHGKWPDGRICIACCDENEESADGVCSDCGGSGAGGLDAPEPDPRDTTIATLRAALGQERARADAAEKALAEAVAIPRTCKNRQKNDRG